jgi:CRISPR/Cas system-associated exonuclease Cas4 (RecB family)
MAPTPKTGLPNVWVTVAAKLLVGDQPCMLEAWIKARYRMDKDPASASRLADFKLRHTALLTEERTRLDSEGWKLTVERFIQVTGTTAILSGKPDLIAQRANHRPLIVDTKGGEPRDTDVAQIKIYMVMVPLAWKSPQMQFDGVLVYANPTMRMVIPASDTEETKQQLFPLLKKLGTMPQPPPTPTVSNCKWCEVPTSMCPDKIVTVPEDIFTSEW